MNLHKTDSDYNHQSLEKAPLAIVRTTPAGEILYANAAALRLVGYRSLDELRRHITNVSQLYRRPEDRRWVLSKVLAGGGTTRLTISLRDRQDRAFLVDMRTRAVHDQQGQLVFFESFMEDTTDTQRALDALEESETRYRNLFESAPFGIYQVSIDGRILRVNTAFARILGYPSVDELVHEVENVQALYAEPEARRDLIDKFFRHHRPYDVYVRLVRKDGRPITARLMGRVVSDEGEDMSYHEGFLEDVTERLRIQKELEKSEQRFRNLVESSSEGIWELTAKLAISYVSPKLCAMLGYSKEELLGRTPFDLMSEAESERVQELIGPILQAHKPFYFLESRNMCKDGSEIILESSGVPFFDDQGRFCGYRGINRDITERKRLENALRISYDELELRVVERTQALEETTRKLFRQQAELSEHKKTLEKMNRELQETNEALNLMAKQVEQSRQEAERRIATVIRTKVMPLLESLRDDRQLQHRHQEIERLMASLKEMFTSVDPELKMSGTITPAEMRIAALIKEGLSTRQIADMLCISLHTVKSHRKNLRKKLNLAPNVTLKAFLCSETP